ncbi:hypothetical protein SAMN05216302_100855 [Nitrosomonas aestuarii]|uniref:Uncharacterized protein n=1 Tax=Nitrosomonas aestuarii TaxID=52441 RepID=A0A1I4A6Y3_9PROT|nr:hypothetical protein [Nitrosomonas aestuarii]SFK52093.1 hypothetical protein SAMN05216302_100855 [Nitrosomonas aestuarii]
MAQVLNTEADKAEQIFEAQAILAVAEAGANALKIIGQVANIVEGQRAIKLELAGDAIEVKKAIAKESFRLFYCRMVKLRLRVSLAK